MEIVECLLFAVLSCAFGLSIPVHAQNQTGFISIDCGIPEGSNYTDNTTKLYYVSDPDFVTTGFNANISSDIDTTYIDNQYLNLRSFPDGTKSCYTLKPAQGKNNKYLIRAGFLYGNYDRQGDVPWFDLYLGVNWWDTVRLEDAASPYTTEIIHVPPSDNIDICLVNTGYGTPFISVLELRPMTNQTYETVPESLELLDREDFGLTVSREIRFSNDAYDRIWLAYNYEDLKPINTTSTVESSDYKVPSIVMETAVTPIDQSASIEVYYPGDYGSSFYVFMHFAELQVLGPNQTREFNIYINDELWAGPVNPRYLQTTTITNSSAITGSEVDVSIYKTASSTLPPLINALEVYTVKELPQSETHQDDVDAVKHIMSTYQVKRYPQGDPCLPRISIWDGLNCSYDGYNPPRIISLDLSSRGLRGEITPYISKLTMLQYLDLSNNSLTGVVPDILSQLPFLRVLNVSRNKLSGSVPKELIQRSKNGTLELRASKNENLCSSHSCKNKIIVPVVATIGAAFLVLSAAAALFWFLMKRKHVAILLVLSSADLRERKRGIWSNETSFSFSEVISITSNLQRVLGSGNNGTCYHGNLNDTEVAVKMFSPSCVQRDNQFQNDAKLLTRVHHRSLTTCLGYCDERTNKGLIYEYMANGSLEDILAEKDRKFLSWQERLQIAADAAQGLEYLHHGCKPPIIHGNLKPANILLNENFQAKLSDFGLSRFLATEARASDYLDPEYLTTKKLTKSSDVYSFGVLLLTALITNYRPKISSNDPEKISIIQWVNTLLSEGNINRIVDGRLRGDFHIDSAWKAVELAMACASPTSAKRPDMTQVVKELNQCLSMEINRADRTGRTIEMVSVNLSASMIPVAR